MGGINVRHEGFEKIGDRLPFGVGQDVLNLRSDELVFGQPEVTCTDLVTNVNLAGLADRHQGLGDTVKNDIDGSVDGKRLRESRLHLIVVLVDQSQQLDEV